jgi:histidine triad (HIT) family protein
LPGNHLDARGRSAQSDDEVFAFLDINPVNYGHTLVIPKEHHPYMAETPSELAAKVFVKCRELMPKIKESMEADYVAVSVVGLAVPHFHVHLIPRYKDDGMANFWPTKKYAGEDMKKTGDKLRDSLK